MRVLRRALEVRELDGPAPLAGRAEVLRISCPHCRRLVALDALAMVDKRWNDERLGRGEVELVDAQREAFDALEGFGWDVICEGCRRPYRVTFGIYETRPMSGWFAPAAGEALCFAAEVVGAEKRRAET